MPFSVSVIGDQAFLADIIGVSGRNTVLRTSMGGIAAVRMPV